MHDLKSKAQGMPELSANSPIVAQAFSRARQRQTFQFFLKQQKLRNSRVSNAHQ
jgi:hypothetical protein